MDGGRVGDIATFTLVPNRTSAASVPYQMRFTARRWTRVTQAWQRRTFRGFGCDVLTGGTGNETLFTQRSLKAATRSWISRAATKSRSTTGIGNPAGVTLVALGLNNFAVEYFTASGAATKAHGQFTYNTTNHTLSWDADGTGGGAATLIATFDNDMC